MRPRTFYSQQQSSQYLIFPSQARDQSFTRVAKFQRGGDVLTSMLCAGLCLSLSFKAQYLPQIERSLCLAGDMLLHRHRAIIWYAFLVAWLNSRGVGCFKVCWMCCSTGMHFLRCLPHASNDTLCC